MRAAVLNAAGDVPAVQNFKDPEGDPKNDVAEVILAGCNPVDILLASGKMGQPTTPSVVGREGIGSLDGKRVYFNAPPDPFGSWAQRCRIDPAKTFPVPDGLDDDVAVACGIAGLAAWLPLTRHADVSHGQSVLILGATGVVGRIAIQAAKLLGAGRVVGAGRNADALEHATELGADATVQLGGDDDAEALRAEAGDGYDVVIDLVYGQPFLAALDATANGATLITIGEGAGPTAEVPFRSLTGRTHVGHLNDAMGAEMLRAGYEEITAHAAEGRIRIETQRFSLEEAPQAWREQQSGPHVKIAVAP